MSEEFIETKDGMKIRKLAELRTSTAEEYQKVMLDRVNEFKHQYKEKSQFNDFLQNTFFKAFSTVLDLKVKADEALGEENVKKVHKIIDQFLLFGL